MHPYAHFAHEVTKPARYMGGEFNSVTKPWGSDASRFVMAFPELYDIGMSHLGTKILYAAVNGEDDLLMERCFCPWFDMEEQLRERGLPLLSLESHRPLSDFDVVGFSLQFEMTFTNVLTMLDLGGVPLHNADRTLADPLVIAGGPTATHPAPLADFVDVFVIGDAEERLPRLLRHYAELREAGDRSRLEIIAELARDGGVYCPDLYDTEVCERTGLWVVGRPRLPGVPERVKRCVVLDLDRYPFPDDAPVAVAEAVFERWSVEIARGCTEGCRFCQAGMIYRPVRERDPQQVIDTLVSAIEKGGFDEAAITSLSTADYSCISPLIEQLMARLRDRRVSLGISSLRAYGLTERTLDEIATVKATGLTFAPEAGTQRMRDVINKNITDDDIFQTCHRVFGRGWKKMKLYFIIGLPTEEDAEVHGIGEMGRQARDIGREYHRSVQVTVSVSCHVPKPHTPFQWAAMDSAEEIARKQRLLRKSSRRGGFKFRGHDTRVSQLECIIARADSRAGWLLERAWRLGARFDAWDDKLRRDAWDQALTEWEVRCDVSSDTLLGTLPVDARLPWDHIDVGLEDGFLAREYRRAVANRLSPPCGKPVGALLHHTNVADAAADERRLVCYDCGIACDMTEMRERRVSLLEKLGAHEPPPPRTELNARESAHDRLRRGLAPNEFDQGDPHRYRLRFTKLGAVSLQGHLDVVRMLPRILRRAGLDVYYSQGFTPRPVMSLGPALSLGSRSLAEYADVTLTAEVDPGELLGRLNASTPVGLYFTGARPLASSEPSVGKQIAVLEYAVLLDGEKDATLRERFEKRLQLAREAGSLPVKIVRKRRPRTLDLWHVVETVEIIDTDEVDAAADLAPGALALRIVQPHGDGGSLKPIEIARALLGVDVDICDVVRLGCWARDSAGGHADPLYPTGTVLAEAAEVAIDAAETTARRRSSAMPARA